MAESQSEQPQKKESKPVEQSQADDDKKESSTDLAKQAFGSAFKYATIARMYGAVFTSRVRTQLHKYLTSPESKCVKEKVLSKNFKYIENGETKSSPTSKDNYVETINTLDTPRGISFTALISTKTDTLYRYDITINITENPGDLLPKLEQINVYTVTLNKNSAIKLSEHTDAYKENRALSFVYSWLSSLEAAVEKTANENILKNGFFRSVIYDNFFWHTSNDWKSADDVEKWVKSLPSQIKHAYHGLPVFKLKSLEQVKKAMVDDALKTLDEVVKKEGEDKLICFEMEFDWNGLVVDGVTLLEAHTRHNWILVDNKDDDIPKLTRANVEQLVPFRPLAVPKVE